MLKIAPGREPPCVRGWPSAVGTSTEVRAPPGCDSPARPGLGRLRADPLPRDYQLEHSMWKVFPSSKRTDSPGGSGFEQLGQTGPSSLLASAAILSDGCLAARDLRIATSARRTILRCRLAV